jgi:SAM-dependent methyltransferase
MTRLETQPATVPGQTGGNYYDKYGSRNPVVRRLMDGYFQTFDRLAARTGARVAHEIGCGEGHLSIRLARAGLTVRACDVSSEVIAEARGNMAAAGVDVPLRPADIFGLSPDTDGAELVVCCEVLEHLDDPERALEVLCQLASPYLLISVPREPLWRVMNMARGRYWGRFGNTPGHVRHWSTGNLLDLLRRHAEIVEAATPVPWTFALCRV